MIDSKEQLLIYSKQRKTELYFGQNYSLQAKLIELPKSSDAKMMMQQTELLETDATVCEIDAHFRQNCLNQKTTRREMFSWKIRIDAQKIEDCCSPILTIKNGSNSVFEPNILAGVEGLEPSRTVLETGMLPLHHTPVLWWAIRDSNPGPTGYEPVALTN